MDSIWKKDVKLPEFPELKEDKKTEVLIIGGGMTGVLCAYFLQERGVDYMLAEAEKNMLRHHGKHHGQNYGSAQSHIR